MDFELKGQKVLITGSDKGIGLGIAEGFLKEDAAVILTGRQKSNLVKIASKLSEKYGKESVFQFSGDLQLSNVLYELNKFIKDEVGRLDHLVCNIGSGKSVPPLEENVTEFERMLNINILNAVGMVTEFLPLLKKSASSGLFSNSITFIGSICGLENLGCPVAYSSAKAALINYSKNISWSLGRVGIRTNVISPGNIMFPGSTWEKKLFTNKKEIESLIKNEVPLQRFGTVNDIANAVVFLASPKASFVNGANWIIDGGQTRS